MIDIHTHPCRLMDSAAYSYFEENGDLPAATIESYLQAVNDVEKALVLALWAPDAGIRASNSFVAALVRHNPQKLIGIASVDPKSPNAIPELENAVERLGFRGVKLGPIYQNFVPGDLGLWPFFEKIQELQIPIIWHQGASFLMPQAALEDARPLLLDKVARTFPGIKMVIAHFGYPWSADVVALLRKHPNVYTDISVLADRPWFLYNALVAAAEYGTLGKVLLGSDYPACTCQQTALALRHINDFVRGTHLPRLSDTAINEIIECRSLVTLGVI